MKLNVLTQEEDILRQLKPEERHEYILSRYEYWDEKAEEFYESEGISPRYWMAEEICDYLFSELHWNLCSPGSFSVDR